MTRKKVSTHGGSQRGRTPLASGQDRVNLSTDGEMNAHLSERFGASRTDPMPSTIPRPDLRNPALQMDGRVQEYFRVGTTDNKEEMFEWRIRDEIPTARELLAPISELIDDSNIRFSCTASGESSGADGDHGRDEEEDELDDIDGRGPSQLNVFNKIEGPWPSKETYLRTLYTLFREDALRPLRLVLEKLSKTPTLNEDAMGNTIGLYEDVRITGLTFASRTSVAVKISFSMARIGKRVKWQQSKRFMPGSLAVIIPIEGGKYHMEQLKVVIIASRPLIDVEKDPPEVSIFFSRPEELEIDCQKQWLMVEERSGFFEAERHTLKALQKMMDEETPMMEYLIDASQKVRTPAYLQQDPCRTLVPVFGYAPGSVKPNLLEDWPEEVETSMDSTQQRALRAIVTRSLAVIQGPPGTGKTFTSVQALRVFIANMHPDDPPLVIVGQTNHALDQILRHVNTIEKDCFVRLGGRSKDADIIIPRTLFHLRDRFKPPRSQKVGGANKDMYNLRKTMQKLLALLQKGSDQRIDLNTLDGLGLLNPEQCASIEGSANQWATAGGSCENEVGHLLKWVGSAAGPPQPPGPTMRFDDYEPAELDSEEIGEEDAEKIGIDDDEINDLRGEFAALEDDVVGKSARLFFRTAEGKRAPLESAKDLLRVTNDLSKVESKSRGAVFNYLVGQAKEKIRLKLVPILAQYEKALQRRQVGRWEEDSWILKQHKVIGLTTTGFSKYRALISSIRPRIILVEEAAEILEAPVIATCVESVQQLVMVGDHKQLRPHVRVRQFEGAPYYLNVSLFERLINNGHPMVQLQVQRRMVPAISRLLLPIYGDVIKDHKSVLDNMNRPLVSGMGCHSTWCFDHKWTESRDETMSSVNELEAHMIVGFIRYLFFNGTPAESMTILTFYNGQRRLLLCLLGRDAYGPHLRAVKVVTVDSYQGEENSVVMLSLVRSNLKQSIGFLDNVNRVCVALSRAQRGFYLFGNMQLLRSESKIWNEIHDLLTGQEPEDKRIGSTLPLTCVSHDRQTLLTGPNDWELNSGGCDMNCGEMLDCGHQCPESCHPFPHQQYTCAAICNRFLKCSHRCKRSCGNDCQCDDRRCATQDLSQRPEALDATSVRSKGSLNRIIPAPPATISASLQAHHQISAEGLPLRTSRQRRVEQHSRHPSQTSICPNTGGSEWHWLDFAERGVPEHDRQLLLTRESDQRQKQREQLDNYTHNALFADSPSSTSPSRMDQQTRPTFRNGQKMVERVYQLEVPVWGAEASQKAPSLLDEHNFPALGVGRSVPEAEEEEKVEEDLIDLS